MTTLPKLDWKTDVWETFVFNNIAKSKSAQWNIGKLDRSAPFRISTLYSWINADNKKYYHTRLTIACAILPTIKGSSKPSVKKLTSLKYSMISAEVAKKE